MIDLHCHILPGLDDGPETLEESLEMCRIAEADGISVIAASPHYKENIYKNDENTIMPVLEGLRKAVSKAGISVSIHPSAEIRLFPGICAFITGNSAVLLGERYLLLELPADSVPPGMEEIIFSLQLKGLTPIIVHPERNRVLSERFDILEKWSERGVAIQLTAMSLTGEFGYDALTSSRAMAERGLVDVVASDAHSADWRRPVLTNACDSLSHILDREDLDRIMNINPSRILKGGDVIHAHQRGTKSPERTRIQRIVKRARHIGAMIAYG